MADKAPTVDDVFDPRFRRDMNIAQRIHLGMTLASYVQKDKKDGMKYTIVSHDAVTAKIRDVCQKCGIIYYPVDGSEIATTNGNRFELKLAVRFENIDNRDDFIDVLGFGYGIDPGDKGPGKATSYAVKYALLKAFGLETGDDPDFDQDVQHRTSTQQRADDLEKAALLATDERALLDLMREPTTRQILASLATQAPAESMRLRTVISRHAKAIGADLQKLADDPA